MKNLKIIDKELDREFRKIRKSNSDDYSIIVKQQEMLLDYYEKNKDQIKIDALFEKYKKLTYDFPNMILTVISFLVGLISSFVLPIFKRIFNISNEGTKLSIVISLILTIIIAVGIGMGVVFVSFRLYKKFYSISSYYLDQFHAKVIEKILEEKGFFVDNEKQYKKLKKIT